MIHSMASVVIAAQCTLGKGGTWDGVLTNLKHGWSPVCICADGSKATAELQNRGVQAIGPHQLGELALLAEQPVNLIF